MTRLIIPDDFFPNMYATNDLGLLMALTVVHDFELKGTMTEMSESVDRPTEDLFIFDSSPELASRVEEYKRTFSEEHGSFETFFRYVTKVFSEKTEYAVTDRGEVRTNAS